VTHKNLKTVPIAQPFLDDNTVNYTIYKFFKNLKKHITLLIYLLPDPAASVAIMSLRRRETIGHLARLSTQCT